MTNSLRTKRKVCFLYGTLKRPSDPVEAEKWDMVNSMIIGWIYSSIEPRLRPSISLVDNAKLMWDSLKRRFSVSDGTRNHQLRADLAACKQGGDSVESYFGKLRILWDDLEDFESSFKCCCGGTTCDAMEKYEQQRETIRVHQFLMGLDSSRFATTRSNLLSRESHLNLDKIYSQVVQEERHLNASRGAEERTLGVGFSVSTPTMAAAVNLNKKMTLCTHCNKSGHEASSCFQLHGFPEWWNKKSSTRPQGRTREQMVRGRGRGSGPRANHAETSTAAGIPNFTPEQWQSLVQFMSTQQTGTKDNNSGKEDKLIILGNDSRFNVIIDSGASHHMTGDITLLTDVRSNTPCPIKLPDGGFTWASKHGTLNLGGKLILQNVLFAPQLDITLISVAQLLQHIASWVLFTKKFCLIQGQNLKTLIGVAEERDGVYHVGAVAQAGNATKMKISDLWHKRLGHPSHKVLSFLSGIGVFPNNVGSMDKSCDVCIRAKQTRDIFYESSNKAEGCFSLIHVDLWGPYRTRSSSGAHYFLTIVDDFSRAVWTLLLLEKSEVAVTLRTFLKFVETQFGKQVNVVRSDNGT